LLQKSAIFGRKEAGGVFRSILSSSALLSSGTLSTDAPHWLREACIDRWWCSSNQLCKPSQALRDCPKGKLILCATWATQPKPAKPQDALEMGKQHLDALAITTRLIESVRIR